ncbi:MAG: GDP-L-fucose synthase [Planctomycetota bacterium]|nr:MAG: GDP-L-fucose synthase [Planctomycetota bacterium]
MLDLSSQRILITGGAGFLGRAVVDELRARGLSNEQLVIPRRAEHDLVQERAVVELFASARPSLVIHLAARIGGIEANRTHPGSFFHDNMAMGLHLVEHARRAGVGKFVHVATTCAYPRDAELPLREESLWDGYPEETTAPYGLAKRVLAVMLDGYRREFGLDSAVLLPANLYGPGDDFDPTTSHVIPALIRRCEDARREALPSITCWGSGRATREFLHVSDAARGVVDAAERIDSPDPINLGSGREIRIDELAQLIAGLVGYTGRIEWDADRPDGQPRRTLDLRRARERLGWASAITLEDGLASTVAAWRAELARS